MCAQLHLSIHFMYIYTQGVKIFARYLKRGKKSETVLHTHSLTPGLDLYQSEPSTWQMRGIERHKAIHMLSGRSAGYLALIIRCRFYFLLL